MKSTLFCYRVFYLMRDYVKDIRKAQAPWFGHRRTNWKGPDRDKGNTVSESEPMLTYCREGPEV